MRFPLKINISLVPRWLAAVVPAVHDPRSIIIAGDDTHLFDDALASIKIDTTWKTTSGSRHPITDAVILEFAAQKSTPRILDIGASSGITSLNLIDALGSSFSHYFVTDLHFSIPYRIVDGVTYFYNPLSGKSVIRSDGVLIAYESSTADIPPFRFIARKMLSRGPPYDAAEVSLANTIHPRLKERLTLDPRVELLEFNVFESWRHGPVDIIKVANVLNSNYFSKGNLRRAMNNLLALLKPKGILVVTDNRDLERLSVFVRESSGELMKIRDVNGGAEVSEAIRGGTA
jgi:SAM-dependent methyltransferase